MTWIASHLHNSLTTMIDTSDSFGCGAVCDGSLLGRASSNSARLHPPVRWPVALAAAKNVTAMTYSLCHSRDSHPVAFIDQSIEIYLRYACDCAKRLFLNRCSRALVIMEILTMCACHFAIFPHFFLSLSFEKFFHFPFFFHRMCVAYQDHSYSGRPLIPIAGKSNTHWFLSKQSVEI